MDRSTPYSAVVAQTPGGEEVLPASSLEDARAQASNALLGLAREDAVVELGADVNVALRGLARAVMVAPAGAVLMVDLSGWRVSVSLAEHPAPLPPEFVDALEAFRQATLDLDREWSSGEVPGDVLGTSYGLPVSFDEVAATVAGWTVQR
jgi:hypothetical protein